MESTQGTQKTTTTQPPVSQPSGSVAPLSGVGYQKPPTDMTDEELKAAIEAKKAQGQLPPAKPALPPAAGKPEQKSQEQPQDLEKLQKTIQDQKAFIGRQSNEVHTVRKENESLGAKIAELESGLNRATRKPMSEEDKAKFFEDPGKWIDEEMERRTKAGSGADDLPPEEREKQEQAQLEQFRANHQAIVTALPDGENIDELMPLMFEIIIEDFTGMGMTEAETKEAVTEFAKNPWKEHPAAVVALAKRAIAEKKVRGAPGGKPPAKQPGRKVSAVMSASHGKGGRELPSGGLTRADIAEMSDEELAAYKEQIKKRQSGGR